MSAETIVFDVLRLSAEVTAIVSTDDEGKPTIYPDVAPQEISWPLIVFSRGATAITTTIHDNTPVLSDATINVTCWARTRPEAEALANAAVEAMRNAGHLSLDRRAGFDAETEGYAAAVDFTVTE